LDWQQFFFSTSGRINRAKYWLAALFYAVFSFVMALLGFFIITGVPSDAAAVVLYVGGGLLFLTVYFSGIVIAIKRLHDRNKSGWWAVAFLVLPGLLQGAASGIVEPGTALTLNIVSTVLGLWGVIEMGCLRGTVGQNRFGEDPLLQPKPAT